MAIDCGAMTESERRNLIGINIRRKRLEAGLTQAALAEIAEIADGTLSRIERGRLQPSVGLAEKIAEALRVPVDSLLSRPKRPKKSKLRQCEARLLGLTRDMTDAEVDDVGRAVKLLIGVGRRTAGLARTPTSRRRR